MASTPMAVMLVPAEIMVPSVGVPVLAALVTGTTCEPSQQTVCIDTNLVSLKLAKPMKEVITVSVKLPSKSLRFGMRVCTSR